MKKQSFRRRNALLESRIFTSGAAIVAVALLLVLVRAAVPSVFLSITAPLAGTGAAVSSSIANVTSSFADVHTLMNERNLLVAQNEALSRKNAALAARVQSLTALLGTSTPRATGVVANVLAHPPQSPYDTLLLDAGTNAGITVGDQVRADGGVPIGTIAELSSHTSRVLLYSAPLATTTAWVGNARTPITLQGVGSGSFIAHISRLAGAKVGDLVYVPGYGAQPIGTVQRLDADAADVTVILRIKPFVNLFTLTTVDVVPQRP